MAFKDEATKKAYYEKRGDYIRERQRRYSRENKAQELARATAWRKENPEYVKQKKREDFIRSQYGLDIKDYDAMYLKQMGMCAICGIPEAALGHKMCVDHDHATSKVRGLLCKRCNAGLGQFKDKVDVLEQATIYLKNAS